MTSMQLRRRHAKRPWKSMAFVWLRHAPQGGGALWRWSGRQLGLGRGAGQVADGGAELAAIVGADQRVQRGLDHVVDGAPVTGVLEVAHDVGPAVDLVHGMQAGGFAACGNRHQRSEEHTSELQSPCNLVCRLLLEKKKQTKLPTALGTS